MTSQYPGALDNLAARTDASPATPDAHASDHTDERDAINAIQSELGLAPSGDAATVRARLDTLDTTVAGKENTGVAAALVDDLSGVSNQATARSNLGLGSIATQAASSVAITGGTISGISDLAVADGGTGASDAATARTNLGLTIGTHVQAYDADLGDIAGITRAKGDLIAATASAWTDLAVGDNGQMLFADSSEATGLKWAQFRSQALKFKTDDYWLMSRSSGASGYSAGTVGSSVTNSNNSAIYNPFSISEEISIKALALHCIATNPGANAVVRIGIYNADPTTGRPSTVLLDAGTTSINASNVKELTFDALTLKPGFYWYVVAVQGLDTSGTANPTFSACATSGSFQAAQETVVSASNNLFPTWFSGNNVTGAFAANPTFSVTRGLASKVFHLWAKVA